MTLPRTTSLALGLLWALAAPLASHAQTDPLAAFACERAHDEARHGDASALCRPLAEDGLADAQAIMGALHRSGQGGVSRDYGEAARWFGLAARQGHAEAQFNLGALYNYGAGVTRDLVEAYAWYALAADAGNGDAPAGRALVEKRLSPEQIAQAKRRAASLKEAIADSGQMVEEPAEAAALPPPTGDPGEDLQAMVDQLRAIAGRAIQDGGADQPLLRQLDDLANLYDQPWRATLLDENFGDGDFTANPAWTVASGRFGVDSRYGLRNRTGRLARADSGSDRQSGGDAAAQIIGAILSGITKQNTSGQKVAEPRAEIHTRLAISDAFTAEVEFAVLTKPAADGGFEFGVFWGNFRDRGYRLVYSQGALPSLSLVRMLKGGVSTIARTALTQDLDDGAYHRITLRRGRDGVMDALLDGEVVISGVNRGIGGKAFAGLTLINRGGDFAFRSVTLMGSAQ